MIDDPEIQRLKSNLEAVQLALSDAEKALRNAMIARSGVAVGDIVRKKSGRVTAARIAPTGDGMLFRVTRIDPWESGGAWVTGNPKKKDGTFGKSERNLFSDWERVED